MPFKNIPGDVYTEALRSYRDEAIIESNHRGRTRQLGNFTYGMAVAQWETEDGGLAQLITRGLKHRRVVIPFAHARTNLSLMASSIGETPSFEAVDFSMDLDGTGQINVHHHLISRAGPAQTLQEKWSHGQEAAHGLAIPTTDELDILQREMERGASGMYAPS